MKRLNLVGQKYSRLTVVAFSHIHQEMSRWECLCECGSKVIVACGNLRTGHTRSCGCLLTDQPNAMTHGMTKARLYRIWSNMKIRCSKLNHPFYKNYGGRGIKVCERWLTFENFRDDMLASYEAHVREFGEQETTIDRIDPNGNYELSNCRWATRWEQNNNQKRNKFFEMDGRKQSLILWSKELKLPLGALKYRIYTKGLSIKDATAI